MQKKICGESAAIDEAHCNTWIQETLPALLALYAEKDVFNANETGLFFKCLPDKTLSFKNEKCYGGKLSKERVTCLLAANMTGTEKLKIVLIRKSAKPRCFRGVTSLPLTYKSSMDDCRSVRIVAFEIGHKFFTSKLKSFTNY
ncbi:tigger transposable element-derived protein 4-like [Euwallacea similis]|uniref:tigger transposable element-derived protein 4-like n=1 Tax=Euwallacea similis TaxID=1736056 RepID=UPI00344FE953